MSSSQTTGKYMYSVFPLITVIVIIENSLSAFNFNRTKHGQNFLSLIYETNLECNSLSGKAMLGNAYLQPRQVLSKNRNLLLIIITR